MDLAGRVATLSRTLADRAAYKKWRWQLRLLGDPTLAALQPFLKRERRAWDEARRAASGPVVLMAPTVGQLRWPLFFEAVVAMALTLRGARVHFLLCDRTLPVCEGMLFHHERSAVRLASRGPDRRATCWTCYPPARRFLKPLGCPVWTLGGLLNGAASCSGTSPGRANLAEHAMAGTLKFYRRADLVDQPAAPQMLERFSESAAMTARAMERLVDEISPEAAVFHHGLYVPQGVLGAVFRARGVRVINWTRTYRRGCFLLSHGDTYHKTMVKEPCDGWEKMPWDTQRRNAILSYLHSRRTGRRDWNVFVDHQRVDDPEAIRSRLGLDANRPLYGLFTNVPWDAQLHFAANAFTDQFAWIRFTLEWFARRPDLQLVIRVHPAEAKELTRQRVGDDIRRIMPTLPGHMHIIPPDSVISTYALGEMCDAALIYGTKVGAELSSLGIPVIVAGEAWVRGKGFTIDVHNPEEYLATLERLPIERRLAPATQERALRYAYHFFFRRMIFLRSTIERRLPSPPRIGATSVPDLTAQTLADLLPGVDPGLDIICDGILNGTAFVSDLDPELDDPQQTP